MRLDIAPSEDCVNIYSFGEICIGCGCCERNKSYKSRLINNMRYCKERIKELKSFDRFFDDKKIRAIQERNIKTDIRFFKRRIRKYKKVLRTLKGK